MYILNPGTCIYSDQKAVQTFSRYVHDKGQTHIDALRVCGGVGGIGKRLIRVKRSRQRRERERGGDSKGRKGVLTDRDYMHRIGQHIYAIERGQAAIAAGGLIPSPSFPAPYLNKKAHSVYTGSTTS